MNITTTGQSLLEVEADLLAIAVTDATMKTALSSLDGAFEGQLMTALDADEFKPKSGSTAVYPTFGNIAASRLLVVGAGDGSANDLKLAAGAVGRAARGTGAATVAFAAGGAGSPTVTDAEGPCTDGAVNS